MKLLNKKGMTLFELLAVIVILGIVAAIAFPTVSGLINNAKKDAFASNVNMFVDAATVDAQDRNLNGQGASYVYTINASVYTLNIDGNATAVSDLSLDFSKDLGLTTGVVTIVFTGTGDKPTVTITTAFTDGTFTSTTVYPVKRGNLA